MSTRTVNWTLEVVCGDTTIEYGISGEVTEGDDFEHEIQELIAQELADQPIEGSISHVVGDDEDDPTLEINLDYHIQDIRFGDDVKWVHDTN